MHRLEGLVRYYKMLWRSRLDLRPPLSLDPVLPLDAEREQLIHLLASSF